MAFTVAGSNAGGQEGGHSAPSYQRSDISQNHGTEDTFWAFVDQKWKDSLNVAAAEPAGWDQGTDHHKRAEAMR